MFIVGDLVSVSAPLNGIDDNIVRHPGEVTAAYQNGTVDVQHDRGREPSMGLESRDVDARV
jgi:hypothetical protein